MCIPSRNATIKMCSGFIYLTVEINLKNVKNLITSNFSTTKLKQIFTQNDLVSNRKTASCTLEDAQSFADGKFLVLVASKRKLFNNAFGDASLQ